MWPRLLAVGAGTLLFGGLAYVVIAINLGANPGQHSDPPYGFAPYIVVSGLILLTLGWLMNPPIPPVRPETRRP